MAEAAAAASTEKPCAVIWLHGLGDTGQGWSSMRRSLQGHLPQVKKWMFPTAPVQPVTVNGGYAMNSWFDLADIPVLEKTPDDTKGYDASVAALEGWIAECEEAGIPSNRIVIGGFSQGAAVSLLTFLRCKKQLGGAAIFSGWGAFREQYETMLTEERVKALNQSASGKANLLWCHGTADDKVPYALGKLTADMLTEKGLNITFKSYEGMGHASCNTEMKDLLQFLVQQLS